MLSTAIVSSNPVTLVCHKVEWHDDCYESICHSTSNDDSYCSALHWHTNCYPSKGRLTLSSLKKGTLKRKQKPEVRFELY